MQSSPLVSVVILNYNGFRYLGQGLKECLDSVLGTNYGNLEIIFVDNGSTDDSIDFIEKNLASFKIKIIKNRYNLGWSQGFNVGMKTAKGKYIVLLSNDMTVDPNWLQPVVDLMETDHQVGLAGFKRLLYGKHQLLDGIGGDLYLDGRVKQIGQNEIDRGQYDRNIFDIDFIGGAMTIRRETLQQIGLFDSTFKIFAEDADLCYRVRKGGYKVVYVYNARIWHKGSATLTGMDPKGLFMEYMLQQNRVQFILIHFTFKRILATVLFDALYFIMLRSVNKKILLKAYLWNLEHITITLKKHLKYGPSPPFNCKSPVTPFNMNLIKKWMNKIAS